MQILVFKALHECILNINFLFNENNISAGALNLFESAV